MKASQNTLAKLEQELAEAKRSQEGLEADVEKIRKATLEITNTEGPIIAQLEQHEEDSANLNKIQKELKEAEAVETEIAKLESELNPKGFLERAKRAAMKYTDEGKAKIQNLEELKKAGMRTDADRLKYLRDEQTRLTGLLKIKTIDGIKRHKTDLDEQRKNLLVREAQLKEGISMLKNGIDGLKEQIAATKRAQEKQEIEPVQTKKENSSKLVPLQNVSEADRKHIAFIRRELMNETTEVIDEAKPEKKSFFAKLLPKAKPVDTTMRDKLFAALSLSKIEEDFRRNGLRPLTNQELNSIDRAEQLLKPRQSVTKINKPLATKPEKKGFFDRFR